MRTNDFEGTATRNDLATTVSRLVASLPRRVALALAAAAVAASMLIGVAGTNIGSPAVDVVQESSHTLAIVHAWPKKY